MMNYLLQCVRPIATQKTASRAAFCPDGVEYIHASALAIGAMVLPANTEITPELCGHLAWMTAQTAAGNIIASARSMRSVEVPEGASGEAIADAIRLQRYGDPANDGFIYILIPENTAQSLALRRLDVVPARRSEGVEAAAAAFAAACEADPKAVDRARKSWRDCVEKAVKDAEIMQFLMRGDLDSQNVTRLMAAAFDRAEYVQSAKSKISGGML